MGVLTDVGEQFQAAIAKLDLTSARKLQAAFDEFKELEQQIAAGRRQLASRIRDEFPTSEAVPEMVDRQASTQSKFMEDHDQTSAMFRRLHEKEWERLDTPRRNEDRWDFRQNQE